MVSDMATIALLGEQAIEFEPLLKTMGLQGRVTTWDDDLSQYDGYIVLSQTDHQQKELVVFEVSKGKPLLALGDGVSFVFERELLPQVTHTAIQNDEKEAVTAMRRRTLFNICSDEGDLYELPHALQSIFNPTQEQLEMLRKDDLIFLLTGNNHEQGERILGLINSHGNILALFPGSTASIQLKEWSKPESPLVSVLASMKLAIQEFKIKQNEHSSKND